MSDTKTGIRNLGLTAVNVSGSCACGESSGDGYGGGGEGCACAEAEGAADTAVGIALRYTLRGFETEIKIAGMTCQHCVSSVTEELEQVDGVDAVRVALVEDGVSTAVTTSARPLDNAEIVQAITTAGYTVAGRERTHLE